MNSVRSHSLAKASDQDLTQHLKESKQNLVQLMCRID